MSLLTYARNGPRVLWVQETATLLKNGDMKVFVNLIFENHIKDNKLNLIERGSITDFEKQSDNWLKKDWFYDIINQMPYRGQIIEKGMVEVTYSRGADFKGKPLDFDYEIWPYEKDAKKIIKKEGFIPFTRITLKNLPIGDFLIRFAFVTPNRSMKTEFQNIFTILGPNNFLDEIPKLLFRIKDKETRGDFDDIHYQACSYEHEEVNYDIIMLSEPGYPATLEDGQKFQHTEPTIVTTTPNPGDTPTRVFIFSPNKLRFKMRVVQTIKDP